MEKLFYKRKKEKNLNENSDKELYFWRTYDGQEIDLIETDESNISAFEIKWGKKEPKVPAAFSSAYEQASYQVVNPGNYLDFLFS